MWDWSLQRPVRSNKRLALRRPGAAAAVADHALLHVGLQDAERLFVALNRHVQRLQHSLRGEVVRHDPLLDFDRLLLVKGPSWVEERGEARHHNLLHNLELRKAATYQTPRTGAESVILKIWRGSKSL